MDRQHQNETGESGSPPIGSGRYSLNELHAETDGVQFWYGYDERVRREVAITAISRDTVDPYTVRSRTSLIKRVQSPAVARILDVFDDAGTSYVVAERRPVAAELTSRSGREVALSVLPLATAAELAHRIGVTLSLDDAGRTQLDEHGVAFVAFPAPAAHHEPTADVRGLGGALSQQLAAVPADDPDRDQLETLADRAQSGSLTTADTMAQVLDHVGSGAPAPSKPMIAPPPAPRQGFLDRVTDPANRKIVVGVAAVVVTLLFAWAVAAYIADDSDFPVRTEDSITTTSPTTVPTPVTTTLAPTTTPTPVTTVPQVAPPPVPTQPVATSPPAIATPPPATAAPVVTPPPTQNPPPGVLPCFDGYTHQPPPDGPCMPIGGQPSPPPPPAPTPAPAPTQPQVLPCYPGYSHQPPPNGPCLPSR